MRPQVSAAQHPGRLTTALVTVSSGDDSTRSGAVFRVKDEAPRAEVNGHVLHLCCEACARYFAQNRDSVLAAREMSL